MKLDYFKYEDNFKRYENIKSNLIIEGKIKKPKITIAIPTYKRVNLLKEALLSAINQKDYSDYNIIVVDNDDNENEEIKNMILNLNSERIFYYKNEKNIGMFGNWNRCIELADGEYLSILNDDDWLESNFLVQINRNINEKKAIYSKYKIHDNKKKSRMIKNMVKRIYLNITRFKKKRKLNILDFFFNNRSAGSLGILFNKEAMLKLGGYNEKYYPSSDYFFHAKYCYYYGIEVLREELANYRIQENESLKPEVSFLWLKQAKEFRSYLIEKLNLNDCYIKYIEFLDEYNKLKINNKWNQSLKVNKRKIKKIDLYMYRGREIFRDLFY